MGRSATVSPVVVLVFCSVRCLRVLLVVLGLITPPLAAGFRFFVIVNLVAAILGCFQSSTVLPSYRLPSCRLTVLPSARFVFFYLLYLFYRSGCLGRLTVACAGLLSLVFSRRCLVWERSTSCGGQASRLMRAVDASLFLEVSSV